MALPIFDYSDDAIIITNPPVAPLGLVGKHF